MSQVGGSMPCPRPIEGKENFPNLVALNVAHILHKLGSLSHYAVFMAYVGRLNWANACRLGTDG